MIPERIAVVYKRDDNEARRVLDILAAAIAR